MTPAELSIAFFLQFAVILFVCRIVGWVARRWLDQVEPELFDALERLTRECAAAYAKPVTANPH